MKPVKLVTRILDRKNVQAMLKALRATSTITVTGSSTEGYEARHGNTLLFAALPGTRGYLVRVAVDLFEAGN